MENTYFIGDLVLTKTPSALLSMMYIFNGAKKTENGWTVYFTTVAAQGYAGGGSIVTFEVNPGDTLRLGQKCTAKVKNPLKPNRAGTDKKVNEIYFDKIEIDMIEVSYGFI